MEFLKVSNYLKEILQSYVHQLHYVFEFQSRFYLRSDFLIMILFH